MAFYPLLILMFIAVIRWNSASCLLNSHGEISTLFINVKLMAEEFEPGVRKYLMKILNSLCFGLLWLSLNVLGGLYCGYGIVKGKLSLGNILFFCWFILSLAFLLYYYYRTWRKYF